jgi:NitT/TauT family transport system ATP-binding protein
MIARPMPPHWASDVYGRGRGTEDRAGAVKSQGEDAAGAQFLALEGIAKTYYTGRQDAEVSALAETTFSCGRGEFITLVGPSGCGKSTILNLVAGLLEPSQGQVIVDGTAVTGPRRDVGLMFQTPMLFPWRTAIENVMLPADVARSDKRAARARAAELLESVGLADFADMRPSGLSGGMEQRVALCRLLMQDPDLMLLDEPFGALDEFTREDMNQQLLDVWSGTGKTVLLVTHNIQEAVYLTDRILVMTPRPGRIAKVLDVDLPRPRHLAITTTPEFQELVLDVRQTLGAL